MSLVRARYGDFGPTLVVEKLAEEHDIRLSRETLRQWMIDDGIWLDRQERRKRVHQPRYRRDCFGELSQIDRVHYLTNSDLANHTLRDGTKRGITIRQRADKKTARFCSCCKNGSPLHGDEPSDGRVCTRTNSVMKSRAFPGGADIIEIHKIHFHDKSQFDVQFIKFRG